MLSIIVPVFNGESNLKALFERLLKVTGKLDEDTELLFVDDGSSDGSLELIRQFCRETCSERFFPGYISFDRNYGQQLAVLCGLRHSRGESVVTIDDDLQHPPEMIPFMLERLRASSDGSTGAVYAVPGRSVRRRAGGRMRDLFFTVFMGKPVGLRIGSYRVFNRWAADAVCAAVQPFVYISAELFRNGFTATSIEYKAKQLESPSQRTGTLDSGRYSQAARVRLYLKLIWWYGPFGSRKAGEQYRVAERGGCL